MTFDLDYDDETEVVQEGSEGRTLPCDRGRLVCSKPMLLDVGNKRECGEISVGVII